MYLRQAKGRRHQTNNAYDHVHYSSVTSIIYSMPSVRWPDVST